MKKYITITGINHYYGHSAFKKGMKVKLVKEPDNKHDKEAIKVQTKSLDKVGYVANSSHTVLGNCMSAGRIYDKIGDITNAKVTDILPQGIVCKIKNKKDKKTISTENTTNTIDELKT